MVSGFDLSHKIAIGIVSIRILLNLLRLLYFFPYNTTIIHLLDHTLTLVGTGMTEIVHFL